MNTVQFPDNDKTGACILSTYLHPDSSEASFTTDRLKFLLSEGIQSPIGADRLAEIERMYAESRNLTLTDNYTVDPTVLEHTCANFDSAYTKKYIIEASVNAAKSRMFTGLQPHDFRIQYTLRMPYHCGGGLYTLPSSRGNVIDSFLFEMKERDDRPIPEIKKISILNENIILMVCEKPMVSNPWTWTPFPNGFPGYLATRSNLELHVEFAEGAAADVHRLVVKTVVSMPCTDESEVREPEKSTIPTFVRTEDPEKLVCIFSGRAFPLTTTN